VSAFSVTCATRQILCGAVRAELMHEAFAEAPLAALVTAARR